VTPARQSHNSNPASLFAIPVGLVALGLAWQTAAVIWPVPMWVSEILIWSGDTPILYLPIVAGAFVTASAAAAQGYAEWGTLAFGAGLFTWFAVESVVLYRLYTAPPLLSALRPSIGVQLAPPAVCAVAYLAVGSGAPDFFAHVLIGYALLQALLFIRLIPWLLEGDLTPAWWSFSFGAAALPTAAMKLVAHGDAGAISTLARYLFAAGNLVIAAIVAVTIRWAFSLGAIKTPVPKDAAP
jgi:tellurite resistance protein